MDKRNTSDTTQPIKLQKLTVPTVDMKQHQVQLRRALLASSRPVHLTTKRRWSNIVNKPKFVVSGLGLAFTAMAFVAVVSLTGLKPASAAEITQHGLNKVTQLSAPEQKELDIRVKGDSKAELEAAKNAKDLTVLTYAQFKQSTPQADMISVHGPNAGTAGPQMLDPASLKYLRYTDVKGAIHIIGVDKDGMPTLMLIFDLKNGGQQGSMKVKDHDTGQITVGSPAPDAKGLQPVTSSCSDINGHVTCTGNGGTPNCQTSSDGKMACAQTASDQNTKQ